MYTVPVKIGRMDPDQEWIKNSAVDFKNLDNLT